MGKTWQNSRDIGEPDLSTVRADLVLHASGVLCSVTRSGADQATARLDKRQLAGCITGYQVEEMRHGC